MTKPAGTAQASKRKNLWVVTELYYPEETSTGYYLTRMAEGLTEEFDVKALCGQPTYSARGTIAPKHESYKNVEIFRVSGTTFDKNIIPLRIINMITFSIAAFVAAVRKFRAGDRVLVVTNPPLAPFIAALASLLKGSVYTLLVHDNYPEILVAAGKLGADSLPVRVLGYLNRWLYKHSSRIIVVGRDMRDLMERKTAGLDIPISVIPNWAELESVSPAAREDNSLLEELGLKEKFVILYAGNIGPPNDLESIVEAAEMLRHEAHFHFVFLGAGMRKSFLKDEIRRRNLANIALLDPRPRTEQKIFLNACDISLVSLVEKMLGVSVPSRTYNILAAGKPILAIVERGSEVARVVEEEKVGLVVSPSDPHGLVEAIRSAFGRRDELTEMGHRARKAAETKYSLEQAIEHYKKAIN